MTTTTSSYLSILRVDNFSSTCRASFSRSKNSIHWSCKMMTIRLSLTRVAISENSPKTKPEWLLVSYSTHFLICTARTLFIAMSNLKTYSCSSKNWIISTLSLLISDSQHTAGSMNQTEIMKFLIRNRAVSTQTQVRQKKLVRSWRKSWVAHFTWRPKLSKSRVMTTKSMCGVQVLSYSRCLVVDFLSSGARKNRFMLPSARTTCPFRLLCGHPKHQK